MRSKDPDLSLRQLGVLLACHTSSGPQTVRGLSPVVGTHKPGITRAVDTLEAYKLARRVPDPRDRRSVLIVATPRGHVFCRRFGSLQASTTARQ
ncbi:MarR family transcriptional regulator [Acidisoma sp. S159]|uniref:MarR family transcriptional regulator n=1 Tax=Acidisoma sp. S159 TaxID=1747225 RepID=UPI00352B5675